MAALLARTALAEATDADARPLKFDFGGQTAAPGYVSVTGEELYSPQRGYGFEPGFEVRRVARALSDPLRKDFCAGSGGFFFSVALAEGNYRVRVLLGDGSGTSRTTVRAELRRLMLEDVVTAEGEFAEREFIVNVRVPQIRGGGEVRLKAPRETTQEAWAWDGRLTLEFNGPKARVCALEIEPVNVPTVYLLGDSTVCDQSREPFTSWGQMLTRFFKPDIAIANHGESGETYRDSLGRRRLDKVVSLMRPGDFLVLQFGHNDQKQLASGSGGPFTTYPDEMRRHVEAARAVGGIPILVTPMHRHSFEGGVVVNSLGDYPEAVRQVARELAVPLVDLHAMSRVLYEALGEEGAKAAFAMPEGRLDATHHNAYGGYLLALCVARALRELNVGLAGHILEVVDGFSPEHPMPPHSFHLPPSPLVTNVTPLGS